MKTTFPEDTIVAEYFYKMLYKPETINFSHYMFYMGCKVAFQFVEIMSKQKSYKVVSAAEDADWFARGFTAGLMNRFDLFPAVRWVRKINVDDSQTSVFTVVHTYDAPGTPSEYDVIYLKPFFYESAAIRSLILHDLDAVSSDQIMIASIFANSGVYADLTREFPSNIAGSMSLWTFVEDGLDSSIGTDWKSVVHSRYQALGLDLGMGTPVDYLPASIQALIDGKFKPAC